MMYIESMLISILELANLNLKSEIQSSLWKKEKKKCNLGSSTKITLIYNLRITELKPLN